MNKLISIPTTELFDHIFQLQSIEQNKKLDDYFDFLIKEHCWQLQVLNTHNRLQPIPLDKKILILICFSTDFTVGKCVKLYYEFINSKYQNDFQNFISFIIQPN